VIRDSAQEALEELRAVIGVLRADPAGAGWTGADGTGAAWTTTRNARHRFERRVRSPWCAGGLSEPNWSVFRDAER
jgi:hypothetical protein